MQHRQLRQQRRLQAAEVRVRSQVAMLTGHQGCSNTSTFIKADSPRRQGLGRCRQPGAAEGSLGQQPQKRGARRRRRKCQWRTLLGAWKERAGAMIFGMFSSLGIYTLPNSLQTLRAKKELKRTFFFDNLCSRLKPKFRAQSSS